MIILDTDHSTVLKYTDSDRYARHHGRLATSYRRPVREIPSSANSPLTTRSFAGLPRKWCPRPNLINETLSPTPVDLRSSPNPADSLHRPL